MKQLLLIAGTCSAVNAFAQKIVYPESPIGERVRDVRCFEIVGHNSNLCFARISF